MSRIRLIRSAWSFLLALAVAAPVLATDPMEEMKQTTEKILSIVTNTGLKSPSKASERGRLIRQAVDERFDWEEMARRALATHWAKRTAEEKKEFVGLFADLLDHTYMKKVEDYNGEKVSYEGETKEGDYAAVKVKIVTQKDKDIPVEYRLKKKENGWLIYDVSIEGVSLINNYRTQFNSIVQQSSYENLVKRLREKADLK
ncbi:MAG TPA: ABC transporter substrate-binding protein [Thermodesulfobacteriota bacterium]|nr:ABC transporter substrate-binding protein [Thermodesulfobacteriota bacterium]